MIENLSIEGKHILSTRPADLNDEFERVLIGYGAFVECFPTIKISPVEDKVNLDKKLYKLDTYNGIFFTSGNGVKYFFERAKELDVKFAGDIYCVGEKTNIALKQFGYNAAFIPQKYSADDFVNELNKEKLNGKNFLFPHGNLSADNIVKKISEFSNMEEVIVYNTTCPVYDTTYVEWIRDIINKNGFDCITFFSPSSIQNFFDLIGEINLTNTNVAVIGKTTLKKAKDLDLNVEIIPDSSTSEYLAKAIVDFYNRNN